MLVVWLHTFVARNGWGAGVCVCGSSTRRDLPSHRDTLADGGGLAYFGCDCEVNALTQLPGSLHEKKLTRELHFLLFLCILFLDAENPFIEGWFCFFFSLFCFLCNAHFALGQWSEKQTTHRLSMCFSPGFGRDHPRIRASAYFMCRSYMVTASSY
jgi:hypothetical protein